MRTCLPITLCHINVAPTVMYGMLFVQCNYDRVDAMLEVLEPIDALLILTVQENDQGKVCMCACMRCMLPSCYSAYS